MVNYKCDLCNYNTNKKCNYNNHIKSKKHINKIKENNNDDIVLKYSDNDNDTDSIYYCEYCSQKFLRLSNKSRHEKTCIAKLYEEKLKEKDLLYKKQLEQEIKKREQKENEIYTLKKILEIRGEEVIYHRKKELTDDTMSRNIFKLIVNNITPPLLEDPKPRKMFKIPSDAEKNENINKKNNNILLISNNDQINDEPILDDSDSSSYSSDITDIMYDSDDVLVLNDSDVSESDDDSYSLDSSSDSENEPISERENNDLMREINSKFINKTLQCYIGNKIINYYVKENIKKQAIWISDVNRLTFILSQEIKGDPERKMSWVLDKKGNILGEIIVDPILHHIKNQIKNYFEYNINNNKDNSNNIDFLHNLMKINSNIDNGMLKTKILRFISSKFSFNANDLLYLNN